MTPGQENERQTLTPDEGQDAEKEGGWTEVVLKKLRDRTKKRTYMDDRTSVDRTAHELTSPCRVLRCRATMYTLGPGHPVVFVIFLYTARLGMPSFRTYC